MVLTSKQYDTIKWVAQYLLPAFGTLYFALSSIWGLPYGEEIIGTVSAVDIFLGAIMGISSKTFQQTGDGVILFDKDNPSVYGLSGDLDLSALSRQNTITLKVDNKAQIPHGHFE